MASAWGSSWGSAWGNSWGAVGETPDTPRKRQLAGQNEIRGGGTGLVLPKDAFLDHDTIDPEEEILLLMVAAFLEIST